LGAVVTLIVIPRGDGASRTRIATVGWVSTNWRPVSVESADVSRDFLNHLGGV
jgi:hypothetical protein